MTIQNFKENFNTLTDIYEKGVGGTPNNTFTEFVKTVGKDTAVETVGALVCSVGEWDGRISRENRAWAKSVSPFPIEELSQRAYINYGKIHSAHIDQITTAARIFLKNN